MYARDICYDLTRSKRPQEAQVGDLIKDPNVHGFSVVLSIGPPTKLSKYHGSLPYVLSYTIMGVCNHKLEFFTNPKKRTINAHRMPERVTMDQLDGLDQAIATLKSHIR